MLHALLYEPGDISAPVSVRITFRAGVLVGEWLERRVCKVVKLARLATASYLRAPSCSPISTILLAINTSISRFCRWLQIQAQVIDSILEQTGGLPGHESQLLEQRARVQAALLKASRWSTRSRVAALVTGEKVRAVLSFASSPWDADSYPPSRAIANPATCLAATSAHVCERRFYCIARCDMLHHWPRP